MGKNIWCGGWECDLRPVAGEQLREGGSVISGTVEGCSGGERDLARLDGFDAEVDVSIETIVAVVGCVGCVVVVVVGFAAGSSADVDPSKGAGKCECDEQKTKK